MACYDLSGRPFYAGRAEVPMDILGTLNVLLVEGFWRAVASSGVLSLHVVYHYGRNTHHIFERIFKAAARALRHAIKIDPSMSSLPSTKGVF